MPTNPSTAPVVVLAAATAVTTTHQVAELVQAEVLNRPVSVKITVNAVTVAPTRTGGAPVGSRLHHLACSRWMPWYPLRVIGTRHWATYRRTTATYPGLMKVVVVIAVGTAIADSLWRHITLPLSVLGGLLAFVVIALRTGLLYELLDTAAASGRMPSAVTVLHYAWSSLPHQLAAELRLVRARVEEAAAHSPRAHDLWRRVGQPLQWETPEEQDTERPREGAVS